MIERQVSSTERRSVALTSNADRAPCSGGVALVLLALLPSCSRAAAAQAEPPTPVKAELVRSLEGAGPLRYSGSLEPESRVDLAFRVSGYVEMLAEVATPNGRRAIDKGDFVKKGTVLARVRAADYVEKLRTAEAQLGEARAQQTLAKQDLARSKALFAGGAITKAELDSQIARAEAAQAQVSGAVARSGEASLSVGDTVLKASMDGVVLSRQMELGTLVSPGQVAISIADTRTMKAVFGVPQVQVERLQLGSPVRVFVGAENESKNPEKLLESRVTRIAPAADSNGRVFSVEAAIANEGGELRAGSVVSVRVPAASAARDTAVVPLRAVIRSPRTAGGFSVFVLEGRDEQALARLRDVTLGQVVGNGVTVTSGLDSSERIVTVGATLLHDGDRTVVIR